MRKKIVITYQRNVVNKELKREKRVCSYVSFVIFGLFLVNVLGCLSSIMGIAASQSSKMIKVILGSSFITIIPIILQRFTKKMLIVMLTSILITLLNLLFFPDLSNIFTNTVISYYTMCFTGFLAVSSIRDYSVFKDVLLNFSRIIALISMFLILGITGGVIVGFNDGDYSMGLGYASLVPLLSLMCAFIERRKVYDLLGIVIVLFLIIAYGSRGPLLGVVLFGVYFLIRHLCANKKYFLCICVCIGIAILFIFYRSILILLMNILNSIGISSRTLYLTVYNLFHDSNRNMLYSQLLNRIVDHPFTIRGINAEYSVVGIYAHNIFIELIYQFGIIIGGIAVVFLIIKFLKTVLLKGYGDKNLFRWIFFFSSIPQLMLSSSLWTSLVFWLWFAMMV